MCKVLKRSSVLSVSLISFLLTVIPESVFSEITLLPEKYSLPTNTILVRILVCALVFVISTAAIAVFYALRRSVTIKGSTYSVVVEYGDLLRKKKCKKVIPFDECFITKVGEAPDEIKANSVCGQYLKNHPMTDEDITEMALKASLQPLPDSSRYDGRRKYQLGRVLVSDDYLLMAFAKLDKDGLGYMNREEYLTCLSTLWEEVDKYYGQTDVCIPILGSGRTRFQEKNPTQQELLDMIIQSYKLSHRKIKLPSKLHIVCRKQDGFSLNKIGTCL